MELQANNKNSIRKLIIALSVIIPVAVAALFKLKIKNDFFSFLPHVYVFINGLTALLLIGALVAVKRKRFALHENIIKFCMGLSVLFLVLYVTYHITSDHTIYGDSNHNGVLEITEAILVSNMAKITYFAILISHIVLSIAVVPLVLFTYLYAWEGKYDKHKKWTRFAWPIWFYVAVSGVLVYWLISPYYA
jgi:putative membrane protein